MRMSIILALATSWSGVASAQPIVSQAVTGTRLEVSATGEVSRVPDIAIISAGVVTKGATATAALAQNARQLERVRAALARAGVAERDVQTSSVSLNPDYIYADRQAPQLNGYQASNQLTVRFRDIRNAGKILDALVAEGANQINGPTLTIDKPAQALDEARARALAVGRARAELYARALGMRVTRLLAVSEPGTSRGEEVTVMARKAESSTGAADTAIVPGQQTLGVTLQMSFELQ